MKICGIELKSNNAIVSIIEYLDDEISFVETKIKKIVLENDEDKNSLLKFQNSLEIFLKENNVEKVALKKRAKKGTFGGGAITFKLEAIIQLNSTSLVYFVTSQAITKYIKAKEPSLPKELNKYQEQAYLSSLLLI